MSKNNKSANCQSIFGSLNAWLTLVNNDDTESKTRGWCRPKLLFGLFLFFATTILVTSFCLPWVFYSSIVVFIALHFLCFAKGKREWLRFVLPFLVTIVGAGMFFIIPYSLGLGCMETWIPTYSSKVDTLASCHFNVMAMLVAFVATAGLWYKGDLWANKRGAIKKILKRMILKGGNRYALIQDSEDKDLSKYEDVSLGAGYLITNKKMLDEDPKLVSKVSGAAYVINDESFSIFKDSTLREFDSLTKMIEPLNLIFKINGVLIVLLAVISTIFSYQAVFAQNELAYQVSYWLGFCAVINLSLHVLIVFYPKVLFELAKRSLKPVNVVKFYKSHIEKNLNLITDASELDPGDYFTDD